MSNTWERAFGSIEPDTEDDLKAKQRKIRHQDWEKEFPSLTSGLNETQQIVKALADNKLYNEEKSLPYNIKELIVKHVQLQAQVNKMKNALR